MYRQHDMQQFVSLLQAVMLCLSIVAYYRMFSINGESGAIAFMPCFRQKVFGRLVGREEDGHKAMIYSISYVACNLAMVITVLLFLVFGISASVSESSFSAAGIFAFLCIIASIATIVFFVLYQIVLFKIRQAYLELMGYENWIAVLWLFFPQFVEIYLWLYAIEPIE